jgi:hypothetical protein
MRKKSVQEMSMVISFLRLRSERYLFTTGVTGIISSQVWGSRICFYVKNAFAKSVRCVMEYTI